MLDPLGTNNVMFFGKKKNLLLGHIDWSGKISTRELCLVFSITLGKLEIVQRTAIKMIKCVENMTHKKAERWLLFSLGNSIFRGKI